MHNRSLASSYRANEQLSDKRKNSDTNHLKLDTKKFIYSLLPITHAQTSLKTAYHVLESFEQNRFVEKQLRRYTNEGGSVWNSLSWWLSRLNSMDKFMEFHGTLPHQGMMLSPSSQKQVLKIIIKFFFPIKKSTNMDYTQEYSK